MLEAALALFAEQGYRATTMGEIAARAGVAVQTVYFTFHTKDELLQAVQDRAVLGDDVVPPHEQPWFVAMLQAERIADSVRHFVDGNAGICARVAPLVPAMHEVSSDPAGAVWRRSEDLRRDGYSSIVAGWEAKARLRAGLDPARAVDLLLVLAGPDVYRQLVVERGWTHHAYAAWLTAALLHELFGKRDS